MTALLKKEVRLLLVPWIVALGLVLVPFFLGLLLPMQQTDMRGLALAGFVAGILSLSLAPMGREVTSRTFSLLLALPMERRKIWRAKSGLLIGAVASVGAALLFTLACLPTSPDQNAVYERMLLASGAAAVIATGLWTTVLLRQVAASMCFTLLIPALLIAISSAAAERVYGSSSATPLVRCVCLTLVIYAAITFISARRMFLRAEDVPWTGGAIEWPSWLRKSKEVPAETARLRRPSSPWWALLAKELQLQRSTFFAAGCVAALHIFVTALRLLGTFNKLPADSGFQILLDAVPFLWLFAPILAGATAVAEERRTGTIEAQLCLPVAPRKQFLLKAALTCLVALVFGALAPVAIEKIGGSHALLVFGDFWIFCGYALSIATVALLASTLTRGLTEALSAAVAFGIALVLTSTLSQHPPYLGGNSFLWPPLIVKWTAPFVLFVVVLLLSARNWRVLQVTARDWLVTVGTIAISWVAVLSIASIVYFRPWEFLIPLEAGHDTPRFSASAPPKLASSHWWISVVLPDGRLWVSKEQPQDAPKFLPESVRQRLDLSKRDSAFVEGSDWRDAAASLRQCVAIRKDGTLWDIRHSPANGIFSVQQIGTAANWSSLSADWSHLLAIRTDGTLWAWGLNHGGQLGIGRPTDKSAKSSRGKSRVEDIATPTQVGTDADWTGAFAIGGGSLGFKTNGSAWCWGAGASNLFNLQSDYFVPQPCPTREIPRAVSGGSGTRAVVRSNGTLWISGSHVPIALLHAVNAKTHHTNTAPVQLGTDGKWTDVAITHSPAEIMALAADGTLWRWGFKWERNGGFTYMLRQLGRNSDWLALDAFNSCAITLAADGGLWQWDDSEYGSDFSAPRRRPLKIATLK